MITRLTKLLRGDSSDLQDWINHPTPQNLKICLLVIIAGFGSYGFTVGLWRAPLMGFYVAFKMPLLILLTIICNGFLNGMLALLLGTELSFRKSLLAQLMSFAVAALILGSLAPILIFTSLTAPEPDPTVHTISYAGFIVTHTVLIAYAGVIAQVHLARLFLTVTASRKAASLTLISWLVGNAFVGTQLSWILRPFLGSPNIEIAFLRPDALASSFYETTWYAIRRFSGGHPAEALLFVGLGIFLIFTPILKTILKHKQIQS